MNIDIYHIDAFVSESCKGNTACIIPLDNWLSDEVLLQISKKNDFIKNSYLFRNIRIVLNLK